MYDKLLSQIIENRITKPFYIIIKWLLLFSGGVTVNKFLLFPQVHFLFITFSINAFWLFLFIRFELIEDYKELRKLYSSD